MITSPAILDGLAKVREKGHDIDEQLLSKCAYYPYFRFIRFKDKKTDEIVQGQQFVCKDCSVVEPNEKCKHVNILSW